MDHEVIHIGENHLEIRSSDKSIFYTKLLEQHIREELSDAIIDTCPLPQLLYIEYDPTRIDSSQIESILNDFDFDPDLALANDEVFYLPVCFDRQFSIDVEEVEQRTGLDRQQIRNELLKNEYQLDMYGFIPGFVYLSGLSEVLQLPRKEKPSQRIPKGSFAIAKNYIGVYPAESPGGWYIIGRTPIEIFDRDDTEKFKIQAGQKVRLKEITREEFNSYE